MDKFLKGIGVFTLSLVLIIICAFITGVFVMLLWNWLMPTIFGLATITYLQGWGLAVLGGLLFKNSTVNQNNK